MLEKYQNKYNNFISYINQAIVKNKVISHAYLLVAPNSDETRHLVIDFAKVILCSNDMNNCDNCNICNLIDINNYSELIIIEPDGLMIKKEQLMNLQENFINKPLNNDRRVYIIFGADKLNDSSGNCILKFLEEPMEGITAILVCENYLNVLKTIVSRCQIINLINNANEDNKKINLKGENYLNVLQFLNKFEKSHEEVIAFTNELLKDFSDRELVEKNINIMIDIYQYVLDYKLERVSDYYDELKIIIDNNSMDMILRKIKVLCDIRINIKYNVNVNLLMDKLIIELSNC